MVVMKLPWREVKPLAPKAFSKIRLKTIFDCCKWDPQVEDVSTLADFPLLLDSKEWRSIALEAEKLASETIAAENEILEKPFLHKKLGLPRIIRNTLKHFQKQRSSSEGVRLMRFDFHFTTQGWMISEANTDVPGGLNEGSGFTRLMSEHYSGTQVPGDPAGALSQALLDAVGREGVVAFVHATAYSDDRQVMVYLARRIEELGLKSRLISPSHLKWVNGHASIHNGCYQGIVHLLVRFFPAEWLPNLPLACGWDQFFCGSETRVCNPATALLTQSKRFPLLWDFLETKFATWRSLLPESLDPAEVDWENTGEWVLKPVFGRMGEHVGIDGVTERKEWVRIVREVKRHPENWVAQKRFEALPFVLEGRSYFPCIGVYTINGRVAGAYGRLAHQPLVNGKAQDIAVLIDDNNSDQTKRF